MYYNKSNYEKALEYYNKALSHEQENVEIYYWLGKVYKADKKKKKAKEMWEKVLEIDSEHKGAKMQLKKLKRGR